MVGIVIVSHSENLAKSVIELTKMMAPNALTAPAGGMPDGSFGTSFDRISEAIDAVYSEEGVLILVDMGSAVLTTNMVIEMMPDRKVQLVDCPLVEGAVIATFEAQSGSSFEEIIEELKEVANTPKF